MDHWQKQRGAIHIQDSVFFLLYTYICSNRPVKLKSVPRLDPRTDVDGRILLATTVKDPHMVDKLLAAACQTYLDPKEYYVTTSLFAGFVVFASRTVT